MSEQKLAGEKAPLARIRSSRVDILLHPGQVVRLGRSAENDIVIDNPKVSRSHALIEWNGSGFTLRDLGSINGTYVNGQLLASGAWLLRDGDEITVHDQKLAYEIIRAEGVGLPDHLPQTHAPGETAPVGPRLEVSSGPDLGQVYPLWGETVRIGRASREATWEIRLSDRSVSRPHALVGRQGSGYYLVDLESANGTLLNETAIEGIAPLRDGDVITIGETRLVFYSR